MTSMADDRDTLSAFFDGELREDAARFAARRLGHDHEWRGSVERWQLIGDVLRGQASMLAPAGFAERVAEAIAAPAEPTANDAPHSTHVKAGPRRSRMWGGMALAASVAAVAAFVVPSMREERAPAAPIASAPATTPQVRVTPPAVAVADAERNPAAPVRSPVRRPRDAGVRVARARPAPQTPAVDGVRIATRPFQPPVDPITTRPWPRATLPGMQAGAAFTAGYTTTEAAEGPSFYPFEPDAPSGVTPPAPSP